MGRRGPKIHAGWREEPKARSKGEPVSTAGRPEIRMEPGGESGPHPSMLSVEVASEERRGVEGHVLNLVGERNLHGATRETREGTDKEPPSGAADAHLEQWVGRWNLFREARSQKVARVLSRGTRPVLVAR